MDSPILSELIPIPGKLNPLHASERCHSPVPSQRLLIPVTPHRISAVFLFLVFIVSKGAIAYRNLEWASPALDAIFGMAALTYVLPMHFLSTSAGTNP
jgi:hypothetical protein